MACKGEMTNRGKGTETSVLSDSAGVDQEASDEFHPVYALLVLPKDPLPGEKFRIVATGGKQLRKAQIKVSGLSGDLKSLRSITGTELPYWRIDDFAGTPEGEYKVTLIEENREVSTLEFVIPRGKEKRQTGKVWKTERGWDRGTEALYSAWINALFGDSGEDASWASLHEVTRDKEQNFLYNHLSLGEDDPEGKTGVVMQPDCADNPFFLRAYFAWKLGLPFGYHVCDRGYIGKNPGTGQWITNETPAAKSDAVMAFNSFLRKVMDGVHSGTARTALDDPNSDYYPVSLERNALVPGTVFADPYGHTMILVSWVPQSNNRPGILLSVDAQPDGTVGIKRFWKGNFLFNTSDVIGEPGFKAFRPITLKEGVPRLMSYGELNASSGLIPFSLQQRKMETAVFYQTMERLINPKPLNPEDALTDLIQSLHEQLLVRVTSVANSEAYFEKHSGTVISMPSGAAGIFLAGGQWEDYSTPNRDLRLLIAMDAVLGFPEQVVSSPGNFDIPANVSPEQLKEKLQIIMDKKGAELSITYIRTDGSEQMLTVGEILRRRDTYEMAYNPNDGIEIRWGAPEESDEIATCRRRAPASQYEKMRSVRTWFQKRLHPPT
ncbi:MAG: hypothetical protein IH593_11790 [Bacteroidales bacterium]|nr:hypothetical protein [Bacteroidales bacterium]